MSGQLCSLRCRQWLMANCGMVYYSLYSLSSRIWGCPPPLFLPQL